MTNFLEKSALLPIFEFGYFATQKNLHTAPCVSYFEKNGDLTCVNEVYFKFAVFKAVSMEFYDISRVAVALQFWFTCSMEIPP